MPLTVSCPGCRQGLALPEQHLGQWVQCPRCATSFQAPAAGSDLVPAQVETVGRPPGPAWPAAPAAAAVAPEPFPPIHFRVVIQHDSAHALQGVFDADLSQEGLFLNRNQDASSFLISPGTEAWYGEANRFWVRMEGRELELLALLWGGAQNRLARDAADFLSGRVSALDPGQYRLPGLLLLPVFLPLGIPILGIFSLAFGVEAIYYWFFFGGGLLALNVAIISRDHWPVPIRLTLALVVTAAGYLIMLLAIWLVSHKGWGGGTAFPWAGGPVPQWNSLR